MEINKIMEITLTIEAEEKKVLDSWLGTDKIQEWLQHALDNKIQQRVDASVIESTNRNPKKFSLTEKLTLLKDVTLPSKESRNSII